MNATLRSENHKPYVPESISLGFDEDGFIVLVARSKTESPLSVYLGSPQAAIGLAAALAEIAHSLTGEEGVR